MFLFEIINNLAQTKRQPDWGGSLAVLTRFLGFPCTYRYI